MEDGHKYKFSMSGKKYAAGYDRIFKKKKKKKKVTKWHTQT